MGDRANNKTILIVDNTLAGKVVDTASRMDGYVIYYDADTDKYYHTPVDPATGVPYSGAVMDQDLGTHSLKAESVILNDTPTVVPVDREMYWDVDNETIAFHHPDGGDIQLGQEPFDIYTNLEGAPIVNGDIVSVCDATGNRTAVCLCDATDDTKARNVIGMVTVASIADNNHGRITKNGGKVRGLNTNAYNEGDTLYVDPANPGKWTSTMPTAPNRAVKIGVVTVKSATVGVVELDLDVACKLTELADVDGTPLTTLGQIPVWHQTEGVFDFDYNIGHLPTLKIGGVSDYTEFEADGTLKMVGLATVYDDLTSDITRTKTVGTRVTVNDAENSIDYTNAATTTDYAYFTYQMTHKWMAGTDIYPHIHFEQANNNTPNFLFYYRWQKNGGAKTTAWTPLKCNTPVFTYVSGTLNQIANGVAISAPVGYGISDILQFRLCRDTTNASGLFGADPYTGTVSVTAADIHLRLDTIGSRTEYNK